MCYRCCDHTLIQEHFCDHVFLFSFHFLFPFSPSKTQWEETEGNVCVDRTRTNPQTLSGFYKTSLSRGSPVECLTVVVSSRWTVTHRYETGHRLPDKTRRLVEFFHVQSTSSCDNTFFIILVEGLINISQGRHLPCVSHPLMD